MGGVTAGQGAGPWGGQGGKGDVRWMLVGGQGRAGDWGGKGWGRGRCAPGVRTAAASCALEPGQVLCPSTVLSALALGLQPCCLHPKE